MYEIRKSVRERMSAAVNKYAGKVAVFGLCVALMLVLGLLDRAVPLSALLSGGVPGLKLGELTLTQTPLGICLRLKMTTIDPDAAAQLLTLRLKGVVFHGSGSFDPNGLAVFDQGQGDFGEIPTIQFLDCDKNIIAEVSFQKIG